MRPAACCAQVQAQAASQAALSAGRPASTAVYELPWLGSLRPSRAGAAQPEQSEECDSEELLQAAQAHLGPVPDSSGRLVVSLHQDVLAVHELVPEPRLLFSLPSPETRRTAEESHVTACWAPDSSAIVLTWWLRCVRRPERKACPYGPLSRALVQ